MPVLHKYKDREGHYVLTSINKTMVTFQLTFKGEERLLSSGVRDKETFKRGLLLDLYRSGDAYTHGTGPGEELSKADSRQLEFDFKDDSDPESLFPTCASCSSPVGLHFVEVKEKEHLASILCSDCRLLKSKAIDTSIPLQLVSRSVLNHILEIKRIEKVDPSLTAFKELLDMQFQAKWEEIAKTRSRRKAVTQEELFEKQGKLIK
jgi:hypothetical protein